MSGPLILLVLAALGVVGLGLQVLSLHYHRFPTDIRRPGPLFTPRRRRTTTAHSAELRRLVTVVSNAILNERSARAELQGVLDQLGADGPVAEGTASRRDRQRRSRRIESTIADLEHRWHLDEGDGTASRS